MYAALQVQGLLEMFDLLQGQHRDVASKTKALHDACERLVAEKERLAEFSESVRAKLAFFDELEIISAQFHSASLAVESDKFVPILRRLDECIMCDHLLQLCSILDTILDPFSDVLQNTAAI